MPRHGLERIAQRGDVDGAARLQQHRLVPVVAPRHGHGEEVALEGQKRHLALHVAGRRSGIGRGGALDHGGQQRHGLALEHLARRCLPARQAQARHDLQAEDGIAAQLEEVVVAAHLGQAQYLAPDGGQRGFGLAARGLAGTGAFGLGRRQGRPVQLAARAQRQRGDHHDGRGHHVVGQRRCQPGAQGRGIGAGPVLRRDVGDEPRAAFARRRQGHGLAHLGLLQQAGLDLAQLDAEAPHLHLVVDAAQVFQLPVLAPAHPVAGAVEPPAGAIERVGHEALGAQGRTAQIAARQARAAQVQLARHMAGHAVHVGIEHQRPAPGHGAADGRIGFGEGRIGIGLPEHGRDHGLGGAVAVDQQARLQVPAHGVEAFARHGLAAEGVELDLGAAARLPRPFGQLPQIDRRKARMRHAVAADGLQRLLGAPELGIAQQQRGAAAQGGEEPLVRAVERERQEMQLARPRPHLVDRGGMDAVIRKGPVRHHHALGLAGGARGVDHIGQLARMHGAVRARRGLRRRPPPPPTPVHSSTRTPSSTGTRARRCAWVTSSAMPLSRAM